MQRLNTLPRLRLFQRLNNLRLYRIPHANMSAPSAAETDTQAKTAANTSGVTTESLQKTIAEKLEAKHVDIEDMSGKKKCALRTSSCFAAAAAAADQLPGGCGQMFAAMIVSPLFEKKNTLARHRLVNSALKTEIAAIHAWTPKCFTPEEWDKKQSQ